jgi:hypothetical protein
MEREHSRQDHPVGPGRATGNSEPLVVRYRSGEKVVSIVVAAFVLPLLLAGIQSGEFALHLVAAALLPLYIIHLFENLSTQQVILTTDRVIKQRWLLGESSIPAGKVIMTADDTKIRFHHGSTKNLRERITVNCSMTGKEMFDRLRVAAVSRFDILLKEEKSAGDAGTSSQGSGAGKDRHISTLLLNDYHKAVRDYRVAIFLFILYAVVLVFIVGLSDDFSGVAPNVPADTVRLAAILLAIGSYLLLSRINFATPAAAATGLQSEKLTWSERIDTAKTAAFHSSLVINGVGAIAFLLFLLTGNLLDFYILLAVASHFYVDFFPRLSTWEQLCSAEPESAASADSAKMPLPARRRSLQVSLVLMGTLAVSAYGDSRHYLYKNRRDCLDDWGGSEQDCREPAPGSHYYRTGYWYGPRYGRTGSRPVRTVGSTTVSRGGFGSMAYFHASFGG